MYRRNWQTLPDDEVGDSHRAEELMRNLRHYEEHCADLVDVWLARHADVWHTKPPPWLTPEWKEVVQPLLLRQPRGIMATFQGSYVADGTNFPSKKSFIKLAATSFKMQQPMWLMPIQVFMRLNELKSHEVHMQLGDLIQWDVSMRHVFYISQEACLLPIDPHFHPMPMRALHLFLHALTMP